MNRNKPAIRPSTPGSPDPEQHFSSIHYDHKKVLRLYRAILADQAGIRGGPMDAVVWEEGGEELIVHISKVRMLFRSGLILVGIPVFCEQTGETEVVVPFAVGKPNAPLGLLAATEDRPRGPEIIVAAWGNPITALAWRALMGLAENVSSEVGLAKNRPTALPVALSAGKDGLSFVLMNARRETNRGAE